jgi:hypothetical protein
MTPIELSIFLLGLAVIVATAVYVAAPLFAGTAAPVAETPVDTRERWERQKRQALAAIKEAELDHQTGKLSDEDLQSLRTRLETQALEAIAALEREPHA